MDSTQGKLVPLAIAVLLALVFGNPLPFNP